MKQAGEEGVPLRGVVNLEKTDDPGTVVRLMMDYMHRKRAQLEVSNAFSETFTACQLTRFRGTIGWVTRGS